MREEMVLIRFFLILFFTLLLGSCNSSTYEEYFCETPYVDDNHFYSQQTLKISPKEFCVTWKGDEYSCGKIGQLIIDNAEDYFKGFGEEVNSYKAIRDKNTLSMIVYNEIRPKKSYPITRKLIDENYHFIFNGTELQITLPKKDAIEGNLKTYDLYAINNVVDWDGRLIKCNIKEEDGSCMDIALRSVGGETFKSWYRLANNLPTYQYDFDVKNLTLKTNTFNKYLPSTSYTCEIWKKQKWWNL